MFILSELIKVFSNKKIYINNKTSTNDFEILETSKEHIDSTYHYISFIKLKYEKSKYNFSVIAGNIQGDMGYHPIGYYYFDVKSKEISNGIIELTWKSWDSCD